MSSPFRCWCQVFRRGLAGRSAVTTVGGLESFGPMRGDSPESQSLRTGPAPGKDQNSGCDPNRGPPPRMGRSRCSISLPMVSWEDSPSAPALSNPLKSGRPVFEPFKKRPNQSHEPVERLSHQPCAEAKRGDTRRNRCGRTINGKQRRPLHDRGAPVFDVRTLMQRPRRLKLMAGLRCPSPSFGLRQRRRKLLDLRTAAQGTTGQLVPTTAANEPRRRNGGLPMACRNRHEPPTTNQPPFHDHGNPSFSA